MQITASQLRLDDVIRGIGIVVDQRILDSEAKVVILGHTVNRETGEQFATRVELPESHAVNVRRAFAPGDWVTVPVQVLDPFMHPEFVGEPFVRTSVVEVLAESRQLRVDSDPSDGEAGTVLVPFEAARHAV